MYKNLLINDLSGGMTDNVKLSATNKFEILNNIIVNEEKGGTKRWGSDIFSTTSWVLPPYQPINLITEYYGSHFMSTGRRLYEVTPTTITDLVGPTGNPAYSSGLATTNFYSKALWRNQYFYTNDSFCKPIKTYKDGAGIWQVRTAGLPELPTIPTVASTGGGGGDNYLYAFCYYYKYSVGTTDFEDFGAVTYVDLLGVTSPDTDAVNITLIPDLVNGATLNYDETNIKIKIYRTTNNGNSFYYVDEISNLGTGTFSDTSSDATIVTANISLYTNGGILNNDTPPEAKYISVCNGTGYYGNVKEGSLYKPYRMRLSKPDDIDSCPVDLIVDFDGDIVAQAPFRDTMIVSIQKSGVYQTYNVVGTFDAYGRGSVKKTLIHSSEGFVSHNSIVTLQSGLVGAGSKGFMFTEGYHVINISYTLVKSYQDIVSTETKCRQICAAYDWKNKLVYFACQRNIVSLNNDSCFILHEFLGIKPESCFTTMDNGTDFQPYSVFFNSSGQLIRGDSRGFIFRHEPITMTPTMLADPKVDLSVPDPNNWSKSAVNYDITTSELLCGDASIMKYGSKVAIRIKNNSDVSSQLFSANDGYKNWKETPEIRRRDSMTWGAPHHIWGGSIATWAYTKDINEIRWLPSQGTVRFYTKQLKLKPSYTIIDNSDLTGEATVTLRIPGPPVVPNMVDLFIVTEKWVPYCDDFRISFDFDNYATEYFIFNRVSDTKIYITDPLLTLVAGKHKWILKGYPKDERFDFVSFNLYYGDGSPTFEPYIRSNGGENA